MFSLLFIKNSNATFWLGIDAGINSYIGIVNEIDFFQNRLCVFIHLDLENYKAGYTVLAYKIPIKIAFLPVGISIIGAGRKNNYEAVFGVYGGLRFEFKFISIYMNSYFTPKTFDYRRLQNFNADLGISLAIFDIFKEIFSDTYTE